MANIMELEINGEMYKFRAGFAFIREIEPMKKQKQNGVEQDVGLNYVIGGIIDGDAQALLMTLNAMNKSEDKRVKKADLEQYIEDECEDIDKLFEDVLDFLKSANCTRKKTEKFLEMVRDLEAEQAAKKKAAFTGNA